MCLKLQRAALGCPPDLDSLFVRNGLTCAAVDYAWPTFEHQGNRFQRYLKPLFGLM